MTIAIQMVKNHAEFVRLRNLFRKKPRLLAPGSCIYTNEIDGISYMLAYATDGRAEGRVKYGSMNGMPERKYLQALIESKGA